IDRILCRTERGVLRTPAMRESIKIGFPYTNSAFLLKPFDGSRLKRRFKITQDIRGSSRYCTECKEIVFDCVRHSGQAAGVFTFFYFLIYLIRPGKRARGGE